VLQSGGFCGILGEKKRWYREVRDTKKLLMFLGCCLMLCVSAFAADTTIASMKTDCLLDASGACKVTQSVTVEFAGGETEMDFPLGAGATNGSVAGFETEKYEEDGYTILKLANPAGFNGSRTFTVTYELSGLVTKQEDGTQLLTLPLLCPKWAYAITSYDFTVTLPTAVDAQPSYVSGYYGDVIEDYMSVSDKDNILGGTIKESLRDHESLQMMLNVGEGYFTASRGRWTGNWLSVALVLVFALLTLVYWALTLRSHTQRVCSRTLPPDSAFPGDLPWLLAGGKPDFNMLVCYWASLGYLSIFVNEKGHVVLRRRVEMGNERRRLEVKLFALLFGADDVTDGASLRYKRTAQKAQAVIPRYWSRRIYAKSSGNPLVMQALCVLASAFAALVTMSALLPVMPVRGLALFGCFLAGGALSVLIQRGPAAWYLNNIPAMVLAVLALLALFILGRVGGGLATMALCLALSVFTGWQTMRGGRRTELGEQVLAQCLGYRRFLSRISEHYCLTMLRRDPQFFYKTLPYAEAMSMSAQLAKKLGEVELEPCEWYSEAKELPNTAPGFCDRFHDTLELLSMSIRK